MKRISGIFKFSMMIFVLTVQMAACSVDMKTPTSTVDEPYSTETIASSTNDHADLKAYAGTTLNIHDISYQLTDAMAELIPKFEDATGITVNYERLEHVSASTKQEIELASGTSYDVMHICTNVASRYIGAGWCMELTDLIKNPKATWTTFNCDGFYEEFLNFFKNDNGVFGLPVTGESFVLYYRTDVFNELGIDKPPATMDELEATCEIISNGRPDIDTFGMRARKGQGTNIMVWPTFLYGYGGRWLDENGYPDIDSPEAVEATKRFAMFINKYGPEGAGDMTHNELYSAFAQGTLAMYFDSANQCTSFEDEKVSKIIKKWDCAPVFSGPKDTAVMKFVHGLMIPANCSNPEPAWLFISWYTCMDTQIECAEAIKFPGSSRKDVRNSNKYKELFGWNNYISAVEESLKYTRPDFRLISYPDWAYIGDTVGEAVQDVILGADAQNRLTQVNKDLTDYFIREGYINP